MLDPKSFYNPIWFDEAFSVDWATMRIIEAFRVPARLIQDGVGLGNNRQQAIDHLEVYEQEIGKLQKKISESLNRRLLNEIFEPAPLETHAEMWARLLRQSDVGPSSKPKRMKPKMTRREKRRQRKASLR